MESQGRVNFGRGRCCRQAGAIAPTRLLSILIVLYLSFAVATSKGEKPTCADDTRPGTTYGKVRLPNLKVESVLRSQQPRDKNDITIITQCSLDRLYMLEEQCNTWQGLTSVAVYYPLYIFQSTNADRLREAITTVENFHEQIDRSHGKCRMDIVLLSEVIKPHDEWSYPYNALRNHALVRSETDVLLLLDADFLVSEGVHEALTATDKAAALMEDLTANKKIIVLPAFETPRTLSEETGKSYALQAQASTKAELKSMFDEGKIIQFADFYPVGHGSSNYKKWFSSEGTEPYPITYKTGYEPYVLVNRRTVPWYDERFRGYGWDKVMQIYHMDAAAFHFVSHPNAWVMHRPHPNSAGYNRSFTGEAYSTNHKPTDHMMKMEKIAHGMMDELKVGTYPDVGVTQLAACREKWSGGKDTSKPKLVWW